jgi:4-hydroxyacetophenone monooxygenase
MAAAIAQADVRVLLMTLVHLTGDLAWLEPPFHPVRDVRIIPDPQAGLPAAVQHIIRDTALNLLSRGLPAPAITDPGDALLKKMMSVCLGEDVPPEYAPLIREEMGLVSRSQGLALGSPAGEPAAPGRKPDPRHVLIVGAGVCGIALGVRLKELGIPHTIIEKNSSPGGVWYENHYPGCGVDTPSHSYCYSFGARYPWSRYFSPREEVQDYLNRVIGDYGIASHIRFKTRVTGARWDETKKRWDVTIETETGIEKMESPFFVSAIGQLSDPSAPGIKGISTFQGPVFHSTDWPDGLDLAGKRLAVIGTGATAMQLVPTVAGQVAAVDVYQRSAQWVRPVEGYAAPINEGTQWLLKHMPFYAEWFRFNMFWHYGDGLLPCLRKDPSWPHPERSVNRINDRHRKEMTEFIHAELEGRPDLIEKCVPSYPPYGKRILLDNGWFGTLLRPNVDLVTEPIDHVSESCIVTVDGTHRAADIIVLATGFKLTQMAARLNIVGLGGIDLAQAWADDNPTAFLGISVPGFPNFFCMLGPNSGPAHGGSVMFQAECQTRYIASCLTQMITQKIQAIDLREDVLEQHVRQIDAAHEELVWTHPSVSTYYRNKQGRVFSVMPWRFVDYWAMTHDIDFANYRIM